MKPHAEHTESKAQCNACRACQKLSVRLSPNVYQATKQIFQHNAHANEDILPASASYVSTMEVRSLFDKLSLAATLNIII